MRKLNFEKYYFIKLKNKAWKIYNSIEDILLIVKSQNIMPSIGILDGEQYKFFYTDNCDAQRIPKGKKFEFRLVLIDIVNYLPVLRLLLKVRMMKQLYDFINKSIPYYKRKAIVTDSIKEFMMILCVN